MKFSPLDEILRFFGICFILVVVIVLLNGQFKDKNGKVTYQGPFYSETQPNVEK